MILKCHRSRVLCEGTGQGLSGSGQPASTSHRWALEKLMVCFPHKPCETVSGAIICSYSHSLPTFMAIPAYSSKPCTRRLLSQRSSHPMREGTWRTIPAQEQRRIPGQGSIFLQQNRHFLHFSGGPLRNQGQPLSPCWREGGES